MKKFGWLVTIIGFGLSLVGIICGFTIGAGELKEAYDSHPAMTASMTYPTYRRMIGGVATFGSLAGGALTVFGIYGMKNDPLGVRD